MPPLQPVVKTYPPRGSLQQFRLAAPTAFVCFRCQSAKKSRLWCLYRGDWERPLCNGCYGRLLSLYEVAAGTGADDERAAALGELVANLVRTEDVRRALLLNSVASERARHLSDQSQRFLGTAEYIARSLAGRTDLDWSAAIIGLCKAVEAELLVRLIEPLRGRAQSLDLDADESDPQLGRVARYCSGQSATPPELGAIRMFVETAVHSKERASRSLLIGLLRSQVGDWPYSDWLLARDGVVTALSKLTTAYRNPAAHLETLNEGDYAACFSLVVGEGGILWHLVNATLPRRAVK